MGSGSLKQFRLDSGQWSRWVTPVGDGGSAMGALGGDCSVSPTGGPKSAGATP